MVNIRKSNSTNIFKFLKRINRNSKLSQKKVNEFLMNKKKQNIKHLKQLIGKEEQEINIINFIKIIIKKNKMQYKMMRIMMMKMMKKM